MWSAVRRQGAELIFKQIFSNGYDPSLRPNFNQSQPVGSGRRRHEWDRAALRWRRSVRRSRSRARCWELLADRSAHTDGQPCACRPRLPSCALLPLCAQVVVDVQFRVNLLYAVDSKNEQFSLDFFVRELWTDERLQFEPSLWPDALGALRVPASRAIWRPDTFFLNAVSCSTSDQLLTLNATGRLNWSRHQTCVFKADFNLLDFPFESVTHSHTPLSALTRTSNATTTQRMTGDCGGGARGEWFVQAAGRGVSSSPCLLWRHLDDDAASCFVFVSVRASACTIAQLADLRNHAPLLRLHAEGVHGAHHHCARHRIALHRTAATA